MKTWISIVVSVCILAAGSVSAYQLNDRWSHSVVKAESKLGLPENAAQPEETAPDLKEMIRENQKKVVSIEVTFADGGALGSGFLYNDKGDIVTNAHVVAGAVNVQVKRSDTSVLPGKVIGIDEEKDIALVRVDDLAGEEPLAVDKETKAEVGDEVMAFGSPLGLDNTVTTGIISGVDRNFDLEQVHYRGIYQISAPITHGNSGGPLVLKSSGKVIGINSAANESGSIGFSIPYHQVAKMLEDWSNHPDEKLAAQSSSEDGTLSADRYTKESISEGAQYLLNYFYESLNGQDYVTAYSLLGSDWQTQSSYDDFRKGYINTLSVEITSISVTSATAESAEVSVIIEAWENHDGKQVLSRYSSQYKVKPENGTLKIITGKGKKL